MPGRAPPRPEVDEIEPHQIHPLAGGEPCWHTRLAMPLKTGFPCCPNGSHHLCRYAYYAYKPRHVCFRCRKAFKRFFLDEVNPGGESHPPCCPECRGRVVDMGPGFRPPPQSQVNEWKRLEALARVNVHLSCCGGPKQPKTAFDFGEMVTRRPRKRLVG